MNLPAEWMTPATVLRGGGKDRWGKPLPVTPFERPEVLIGPRVTEEPDGRSEETQSTVVLYDRDTAFIYESTDQIRIPEGQRMAGTWAVKGRPNQWPFGTEVPLERA